MAIPEKFRRRIGARIAAKNIRSSEDKSECNMAQDPNHVAYHRNVRSPAPITPEASLSHQTLAPFDNGGSGFAMSEPLPTSADLAAVANNDI